MKTCKFECFRPRWKNWRFSYVVRLNQPTMLDLVAFPLLEFGEVFGFEVSLTAPGRPRAGGL